MLYTIPGRNDKGRRLANLLLCNLPPSKIFQHSRARADFDQNTPGIPFLFSVQPSMKFTYRYLWEFLGGIIIILKACSISCSYQPVLGPFWMPTNSLWRLYVVRRTPSIVTELEKSFRLKPWVAKFTLDVKVSPWRSAEIFWGQGEATLSIRWSYQWKVLVSLQSHFHNQYDSVKEWRTHVFQN